MTVQAPLQSLLIAFLVGVLVADGARSRNKHDAPHRRYAEKAEDISNVAGVAALKMDRIFMIEFSLVQGVLTLLSESDCSPTNHCLQGVDKHPEGGGEQANILEQELTRPDGDRALSSGAMTPASRS
jgi:hypothetical protein